MRYSQAVFGCLVCSPQRSHQFLWGVKKGEGGITIIIPAALLLEFRLAPFSFLSLQNGILDDLLELCRNSGVWYRWHSMGQAGAGLPGERQLDQHTFPQAAACVGPACRPHPPVCSFHFPSPRSSSHHTLLPPTSVNFTWQSS